MKKNKFSIALLGLAGAGKTSYVAALCKGVAHSYLLWRTGINYFGQTVIPCHYRFVRGRSQIREIILYKESVRGDGDTIDFDKLPVILRELVIAKDVKITECICEGEILLNIPIDLDIIKLSQLDTYENVRYIHHITINVSAEMNFRQYLEHEGVKEFVIRDLRGFGNNFSQISQDGEVDVLCHLTSFCNHYDCADVDGIVMFLDQGSVSLAGEMAEVYEKATSGGNTRVKLLMLSRSQLLAHYMQEGHDYDTLMSNKKLDLWDTLVFHEMCYRLSVVGKQLGYRSGTPEDIKESSIKAFTADFSMSDNLSISRYQESVLGSIKYLIQDIKGRR